METMAVKRAPKAKSRIAEARVRVVARLRARSASAELLKGAGARGLPCKNLLLATMGRSRFRASGSWRFNKARMNGGFCFWF